MYPRHPLGFLCLLTVLAAVGLSGCAYIGAAVAVLAGGDDDGGDPVNQAPSIQFNLIPDLQATDLAAVVDYQLIDPEGSLIDIEVEFSTDSGNTYALTSEGSGSEGTGGLSSSSTGEGHTFVWDFFRDLYGGSLPNLQTQTFQATLRFTLSDGVARSPEPQGTVSFRVGNLLPTIGLDSIIADPLDPHAVVRYTVTDDFSDDLTLLVEYSLDGFASLGEVATLYLPPFGSCPDGLTGLASSPSGVQHCFRWDFPADVGGAADPVTLRLTVTDTGGAVSLPELGWEFRVGNDAPVATVTQVDTQFGVSVDFILLDSTSDTASVLFEYSTDGVSYTPSGNVFGSLTGLAASPQGVLHNVAWNSLVDLGVGSFPTVQVRLTPSDAYDTGIGAESSPFGVQNTAQPQAFITAPGAVDVVTGDVQVDYLLLDSTGDLVDVLVEVRGGGAPVFVPGTAGAGGDGVTALTSSPAGDAHVFIWDSLADLGPVDLSDVEVRITPSDLSGQGTPGLAGPIRLDNNGEPVVQNIQTPASPATGNVTLVYDLADGEGDPADIRVQFSTDGGTTFSTFAHEWALGSDGTQGLASSPAGFPHVYRWNSLLDLGPVRETNVVVRITPSDNPDPDLGLGTADQTLPFTVDNDPATAPPSIGTVLPNQGPAAGGNAILITGTGFVPGTTAEIGGQPLLNESRVSSTTITGDVPPYGGGSLAVEVTVTNVNGTAILSRGYTYQPGQPEIFSVTPGQGALGGGNVVTVVTRFFQDDWTALPPIWVQFGGFDATNVTGIAVDTFTCTTPPSGAGPGFVDVYVEGELGDQATLAGGFEYIDTSCTITAITPGIGGVTGGTLVTIDGSGFLPAPPDPIVLFGGLQATIDPATTDTQIVCTTPHGVAPGPVDVEIYNSALGSCLSAGGYTFDTEGLLDTSLNGRGRVLHSGAAGGGTWDVANAAAVDPTTGRILVTGSGDDPTFNTDMVIWAFNPDGTLDTGFNGQGWVVHDNAAGGAGTDEGADIALDAAGRVIVAGRSDSALSQADMAIWRYNPDGSPDGAFNGQGWVTHNSAGGGDAFDAGLGVTLDGAGRILVTGYSGSGTSEEMVIWRYDVTGSIDGTFAGQGWVVFSGPAGLNDRGFDITLDGSGNILVAGHSYNAAGNADMATWRYDSIGAPDPLFGAGGVVLHDSAAGGSLGDSGRALAIDPAGRILVAGYSRGVQGDDDMVVWRLRSDGTLDGAFGGLGWVVHTDAAGGAGNDYPQGIAVDVFGRIVVAGYSMNIAANNDMVIWRFDSTGALDTSFGGQGFTVHDDAAGGNDLDLGLGLALDAAGRIIVPGQSLDGSSNAQIVLWRSLPDGTIDAGFDPDGGFVVHDILLAGIDDNEGLGVAVDPSGRILAAGYAWNQIDEEMALWAFDPDGTLDPTFNGQGWVTHDNAAGGGARDAGKAIAVDASGRLIVVGESEGSLQDMVIWRYLSDGTLDPAFGVGGVGVVVHNNAGGGNAGDGGSDVFIEQPSGRILVAGYSAALAGDDMVIWAYDSNGFLDINFNLQGWVTHHDAAGGGDADQGHGITVDATGRILVTGWSYNPSLDMDMVVWAFNPDGTIDGLFGGQGWVTHHDAAGGGGDDRGNAITVDGANRILVTGQSVGTNSDDMAIWALNPDGTFDGSFNGQGWVTDDSAAGGLSWDAGLDVIVDSLGRTLVAGYSRNATPDDDMVVWRYDPTGLPDLAFGTGGVLVHSNAAGGDINDSGSGITLNGGEGIIVAGSSHNSVPNLDLAIWRLK